MRHLARQLTGAVAAVAICFGVAIIVLQVGGLLK